MKIVNESTFKSSETKDRIKASKEDLKNLLSCNSLEDLGKVEWKAYRYDNIIKKYVDKGLSIEDAIDKAVDGHLEVIQYLKSQYLKEVEYEKEIPNVLSKLHDALDPEYTLLSETDETLVYEPMTGATHEDCIDFVDKVVKAVGGKYHGTGRGGSWTKWDILTDKGISLKAGWSDNNWIVIVK